jgi:hypothetical protein
MTFFELYALFCIFHTFFKFGFEVVNELLPTGLSCGLGVDGSVERAEPV